MPKPKTGELQNKSESRRVRESGVQERVQIRSSYSIRDRHDVLQGGNGSREHCERECGQHSDGERARYDQGAGTVDKRRASGKPTGDVGVRTFTHLVCVLVTGFSSTRMGATLALTFRVTRARG